MPTYIHTYIHRQPVWVHLLSYVLCLQQVAVFNCSVFVDGVLDHFSCLQWLPTASSTYIAAVPQQCALFVTSPGAALASAVHSGSMRWRLISSVSCLVSSTHIHTYIHTYIPASWQERMRSTKNTYGGRFGQQSEHVRFSWPSSVLGGRT